MHETSCCDSVTFCLVQIVALITARTWKSKLLNSKTSNSTYGGWAFLEAKGKTRRKFMRQCRYSIARRNSHRFTLDRMLFIGHYSVFPEHAPTCNAMQIMFNQKEINCCPRRHLSLIHMDWIKRCWRNLSSLYAFKPSFAFKKRLKFHNLHFKSMVAQKLNQLIRRASV